MWSAGKCQTFKGLEVRVDIIVGGAAGGGKVPQEATKCQADAQ